MWLYSIQHIGYILGGIVMTIQILIISFGRNKSYEIHMIRKIVKKDREVSKLIIKRPNDGSGSAQL